MYVSDTTTINYLADGTREYDCKIEVYDGGVLSTTILQSDGTIYPFTLDHSIQTSNFFTIGSIHSSGVKIPLDNTITIPKNGELRVFFRLNGDSGYGNWIPMGAWFVDNRYPSGDNVVVYQCYDELIRAESTYVSALTYPTTAQAVWDEIISQLGLTSSVTLSAKTITAAISGDTHRIALGDIAGLYGGSLIINRSYEVDIVYPYSNTSSSFTITTGLWDGFERIGDDVRTISRVTCIYNNNGDYITLGDDTDYEMIFYSRLIRSITDLQEVFDNYDGITFVPYTHLKWIGDPRLDVGDRITIVDKDNTTTYVTFAMTNASKYGGGLSMTNTSTVYSETESEFDVNYGLAKFVRTSVKQGVPYYGVTIDTEVGINIKRSDGFSETTINSDTWEVLINSARKFWVDFIEGEMYFDGKFSANAISAMEAEIDVVVTNTTIVNNLYSEYGRIANLAVSELNTSFQKIVNYLKKDTNLPSSIADISYRHIYEDEVEVWICTTDGSSEEFVYGYDDIQLYWTDDTYTQMHTDVTVYPVKQWVYDEMCKYREGTEPDENGVYIPYRLEGAGDGNTELSGKYKQYKGTDGEYFVYHKQGTDEEEVYIKLGEDGIEMYPAIMIFPDSYNATDVAASALTILQGIDVGFRLKTKVAFDIQMDITASEAMSIEIAIRVNGIVHRTTTKYFGGAYKDGICFNGLLDSVIPSTGTVDVTITPSVGTATILTKEYRMMLTIRDGSATEAAPWPQATVSEVSNMTLSVTDDIIVTTYDGLATAVIIEEVISATLSVTDDVIITLT